MEANGINNLNNVFYLAINTLDEKCSKAFKNHIVSQDVIFSSPNVNALEFHANVDALVEYINRQIDCTSKGKEISMIDNILEPKKVEQVFDTSKIILEK